METLEASTTQIQQTSDIKALRTSLIDSDKLVVAGGSFSQVVTTIYNTSVGCFPGLDILRSAISISAMHDARGRLPPRKCFSYVYTGIREIIIEWSAQTKQPPILYLTGGSKSGKSALAYEIAETLSSLGTLAGSFFFEGHKIRDDCDFFLTLAYQIAVNIPGMDNLINIAVLRDPTILEKRGEIQLTKLILEPLFCLPTLETSFTVVVDDFDQCGIALQVEIMWLLSRASLTFGDTLRFLFFALGNTLVIGGNNYDWVGRHISLDDMTARASPLHLSQLANQLFDPCPWSIDSINKMWVAPSSRVREQRRHSYTAAYPNPSSSNALPKPHTDIIGNAATVPADFEFSGSPMSVDLLRQSPHGMVGSPMLIDSLKSSPRYGGSPMLIDSIYLSQQYDFDAGPTSFHAVHQRLDINPTNSPSKLVKEVTEQFRIGSSACMAICNSRPVDALEGTVEEQIEFWQDLLQPDMTTGEGHDTAVGKSTSNLSNIDDQ